MPCWHSVWVVTQSNLPSPPLPSLLVRLISICWKCWLKAYALSSNRLIQNIRRHGRFISVKCDRSIYFHDSVFQYKIQSPSCFVAHVVDVLYRPVFVERGAGNGQCVLNSWPVIHHFCHCVGVTRLLSYMKLFAWDTVRMIKNTKNLPGYKIFKFSYLGVVMIQRAIAHI